MDSDVPEIITDLECPVLKKQVEVYLDIYPYRQGNHGGVDVTHCSEFLHSNGVPSCGKDCMYSPEAQDIHLQEVYKHQSRDRN